MSASNADNHLINIAKLCRICGLFLSKDKFLVSKYVDSVKSVFHVNCHQDQPDIHPQHLCMKCYSTIRNVEKRGTCTSLIAKTWTAHSNDKCNVCISVATLKKGRRKKTKEKKSVAGRPKEEKWTRTESISLEKKSFPDTTEINKLQLNHLINAPIIPFCTCLICEDIVTTPITITPCEHIFCLHCLLPKLEGTKIKRSEMS